MSEDDQYPCSNCHYPLSKNKSVMMQITCPKCGRVEWALLLLPTLLFVLSLVYQKIGEGGEGGGGNALCLGIPRIGMLISVILFLLALYNVVATKLGMIKPSNEKETPKWVKWVVGPGGILLKALLLFVIGSFFALSGFGYFGVGTYDPYALYQEITTQNGTQVHQRLVTGGQINEEGNVLACYVSAPLILASLLFFTAFVTRREPDRDKVEWVFISAAIAGIFTFILFYQFSVDPWIAAFLGLACMVILRGFQIISKKR